jgi:hypothetical protein
MNLDSNDPNLDLELQDAAGNVLASSNGASNLEHLAYYIQNDGTYFIHCYYVGFAAVNAGDYWLDVASTPTVMDEVENNDDLSGANSITFPLNDFNGHCGGPIGYDGDSDDYFTFDAAEGDVLSLTMAGTDSNYDLNLFLLDGSGAQLASSNNVGPNETINYEFQAGDTGPFYLHVHAVDNSGFYALNGTCGPALWDTHVIDDSTSSILGTWSVLSYTGGHPGCFYMDGDNADVYFAYSDDADGMGTWTVYPVDVSPSDVGYFMSGGEMNGYPAVAYADMTLGGIKFAVCSTADGSGKWNVSFVDNEGANDPSIAFVNGYPAVAYEGGSETLFYATNDQHDGTGGWARYPVETGNGSYYTGLVELISHKPGITYDAYEDNEIHYATCDASNGSGTWTVKVVDTTAMFAYPNLSATLVQGYPAVAYWDSSSNPRYAVNSAFDGTGSWTAVPVSTSNMPPDMSYMSLAVIDGYPALYYHDDNYDIHYAKSASLDGTGTWLDNVVILQSECRSNSSLGWVNSKPAGVFMDENDTWVGFATPSV